MRLPPEPKLKKRPSRFLRAESSPKPNLETMTNLSRLSVLLPSILVAWLIGCVSVHGPVIFAYLAMHAVTTGVFATFMWRAERTLAKSRSAAAVRPAKATPQPASSTADRKAAVA